MDGPHSTLWPWGGSYWPRNFGTHFGSSSTINCICIGNTVTYGEIPTLTILSAWHGFISLGCKSRPMAVTIGIDWVSPSSVEANWWRGRIPAERLWVWNPRWMGWSRRVPRVPYCIWMSKCTVNWICKCTVWIHWVCVTVSLVLNSKGFTCKGWVTRFTRSEWPQLAYFTSYSRSHLTSFFRIPEDCSCSCMPGNVPYQLPLTSRRGLMYLNFD